MRVLPLTADQPLTEHGSTGLTVGRLVANRAAACSVLRLSPGGVVGSHDAPVSQLLVVVEGDAVVEADGASERVGPGQAVWWDGGENHRTSTDAGLLAVVVESDGLEPPG